MSLAKIRSTSGVEMTIASTAASANRGSASQSSRALFRVKPMLSTRNRSRLRITAPQSRPRTMAPAGATLTPSCRAKVMEKTAIPAVVSRTPAIWVNRVRSCGTCASSSLSPPPSQAMKSLTRFILFALQLCPP